MPTTMTPETLHQRQIALNAANVVRMQRAQVKRDLKAGRVTLDALLCDPPPWMASMKVIDVLGAVPNVGVMRVNRALMRAQVSSTKAVGALTERQRLALVAVLTDKGREAVQP